MADWAPLLVTADDVADHAAATVDAIDTLGPLAATVAQAGLDDWLGYGAFAHVATARVWAPAYRLPLAPAGPASVALSADVSVDTLGRLDLSGAGAPGAVRYVAGWRRPGQSDAELLAAMTADGEILRPDGEPIAAADLAPVPPAPPAVVSALAEAAVVVARRLEQGAGKGADTVRVGDVTTVGPDYRLSNVNRLIGRVTEVEAIYNSRLRRFQHIEA